METRPCIYIVDDDEDDILIMQQALLTNDIACDVQTFTNGAELIRWLTESASTNLPSFIIVDLNMPIMNGFETIQYLKKTLRYDKVPVLMMTTSSAEGDVARAYSLGINLFIVKPNQFRQLQEIMHNTLHYWLHTNTLPAHA